MIRAEYIVDTKDEYEMLKDKIENYCGDICLEIDIYCHETTSTHFFDIIEVSPGRYRYIEQ